MQDVEQDQHTEGKTEHKLVMSDHYGQATMSATLREDGRIEARTESVAAEGGSCSALSASVTADHNADSPVEEASLPADIPQALPPAQADPPAQAASGSACPAEVAASKDSQEAGFRSGSEVTPENSAIAAAMQQELAQGQTADQSTAGLAAAASEASADARAAPGDDLASSIAEEAPEDTIEDMTGELPEPNGEHRPGHVL